jgi:hypothetical protein
MKWSRLLTHFEKYRCWSLRLRSQVSCSWCEVRQLTVRSDTVNFLYILPPYRKDSHNNVNMSLIEDICLLILISTFAAVMIKLPDILLRIRNKSAPSAPFEIPQSWVDAVRNNHRKWILLPGQEGMRDGATVSLPQCQIVTSGMDLRWHRNTEMPPLYSNTGFVSLTIPRTANTQPPTVLVLGKQTCHASDRFNGF